MEIFSPRWRRMRTLGRRINRKRMKGRSRKRKRESLIIMINVSSFIFIRFAPFSHSNLSSSSFSFYSSINKFIVNLSIVPPEAKKCKQTAGDFTSLEGQEKQKRGKN